MTAAHNPRVNKVSETLLASLSGADVPSWLASRVGGEARAAAVLHHGGLWRDGRAWSGEDVGAGATLAAYAFDREPEPVPLAQPLVLWESPEDGLVAVDKPAWLPIQGTRASRRFSLEFELRERLGAPELTAVHRLDRETSGVVLFAHTGADAARLHRQFRARRVVKTYLAVVSPAPLPSDNRFTVRGQMVRIAHPSHSAFALMVGSGGETWGAGESAEGAASETHFAVISRAGDVALVAARPLTGRTHQLRVHLAHVGCGIVGDGVYGPLAGMPGPTRGPGHGDDVGPRLQLHAHMLVFDSARGPVRVIAPPPADLQLPGGASALPPPDALDGFFPDVPRIDLGSGV